MTEQELLQKVLTLPQEKRASFAREIIASLEATADPDIESSWIAEIEHRVQQVRGCTVNLSDWTRVRERIEVRLAQRK